ncbi:Transcriptional regulatory protein BtsR [Flavobacterium bizetiae]|uniref:Transcriptional regulatory protein BtsR n=1 Tax=Flavobacterium bizetiae TaxID=2704140 RepID=A0A6J4GQV5_9FLAO|nr:LytTR family DNA-binding domain-containing protein [Flavobacterium bizetiae]CAA9200653.1 Transcriptional regulatory protein BtsR [Flavobacterium bizetiae]CAD5343020.1 Transcriptional regulatory protein BtsR [Flavobacterium bizetiae]CAD5350449.1 Transcriptional regulatory protein BtsR [Flavobacterium bizetiae]
MSEYLTAIIVDDEPPAIRLLQKYFQQLQGIKCVATCTRAVEALALIETHKPDVVFLDIQMPDLNGIQLSAIIKDKVKIVFTTAYPQFAIEGFEVNAIDYLLKPIPFERFIVAVEKVRKQQTENTVVNTAAETNIEDYFFVKTDGKKRYQRIEVKAINYLESIKNYVVLHTASEQVVTYNTLKYFEENLPGSQFVKIHKSFIAAIGKIEKTDNNEVWVSGKCLPIGDTYRNDFFERIERFEI